ncbi:peptide chain release factor 1 [Clostridium acetobutylicum]|uniref:Peptide chain release factor 1 n=1 Tax=Clostridium acetobutylicum (strain ATCC 824 / DSM 792 / JCM 1419 / IAM 19013 / LMG 5710 / NBRC 13948 / NRRL B-527 / VKM B-1787 / 2291 / W) TaxID=272562 RepID=RF1_CLOAB|nr:MULTISPECIES: peptide chain release factor 1 [Clostridium]Q97F68.1 RecName: Full=Peptide chain release factor 1; Short=RF-1 [Clostridium acetobutylicum ATCC 824]AAK80827.1 Protein chain release factor A [Clostridium acetobutylicum ATCC 824]ADZ21928.1 peptide chain release factor 1 [Clostridium acetobutylicum EA 2018]AEI33998.1 peptide chain release factor 1 [Clostridium acetobutylicum DSM 1731]AWV78761.1 peptide chain release factor 1 [Clostridium acetobutylicum]MBC2393625.1 peptide chain 
MLERLEFIESKYDELSVKISDPSVMANQSEWQKLCKEHSEVENIVLKYREYKKAKEDLEADKEMLRDKIDAELKEMVEEEIKELEKSVVDYEEELRVMLLPKDPNDSKNVFVEIRGGTGGEEAALFAADLFRMYTRYAERQGWHTEVMSANETDIGGFKEIVFMVKGNGAYSRMKYESGTHRVQRVPNTESSGRIHTSAATVAVLPEVDDVDIEINPNDIRIDVFRASGHGGQCVNTTDSAVRITHLPTGIVVSCQDEKRQLKNKEKAMKVLRARLYEKAEAERNAGIAENRRNQVGSGDRSERIRTYNFPQGRITDHRIGLTIYKLEQFLDGDIDEVINGLITAEQAEKMKEMGNTKD